MVRKLKLLMASVFRMKKEASGAQADNLNSIEFKKDGLLHARTILTKNILNKLGAQESILEGSKFTSESPFVNPEKKRGKPPTSYILKSNNEDYFKQYEVALNSTNLKVFQASCAVVANRITDKFKSPKGIVIFVKFRLELNVGEFKNFLAILTTSYSNDIVRYKETELLSYLTDVFRDEFISTALYPRLILLSSSSSGAVFSTDSYFMKIHVKQSVGKEIYDALGVKKPVNSEKKAIADYEDKKSNFKSLKEMNEKTPSFKKADVSIDFGFSSFKMNLAKFASSVKLIVTPYGQGIVFKNQEMRVELGKHNLFSEEKIKKYDAEELTDDK